MECIARITHHGTIHACGKATHLDASYCDEHADRPLIVAERVARQAEIVSRIARCKKASTLPRAISRPRTATHASLAHIVDYIDSVDFYGRTAHETTLSMLDAYSGEINRRILDKSLDGFALKAIERDIDRLIERSRGKLLASALRMQSRKQARTHETRDTHESIHTNRVVSITDMRHALRARV